MPGANRNNVKLTIELDGRTVTRMNRALKLLGEKDAPFIREAIADIGDRFAGELRARAPGSMASKVRVRGLRGSGASIRSTGFVDHPGSKSMEFGRVWYYRKFQGNNRKSPRGKGAMRRGQKFSLGSIVGGHHSGGGQKPRPYMGIVAGDRAVGAVQGFARERLREAVTSEWARLAGGGGPD